jgi:hypothetical protein
MVFYCIGILWAYSSVFASSVASLFFQLVLNQECDIYANPEYAFGFFLSLAFLGPMLI